jgi:EAL domain-containing protein (putative c-di-GMP-specific phosphodiesterase class I)
VERFPVRKKRKGPEIPDSQSRSAIGVSIMMSNSSTRNEKALSCDLDAGDYYLVYQPICRLDGTVLAYEALCRCRHPVLGDLNPAFFIPLAESSGAIHQLGRHVLRESCRAVATWMNTDRASYISVNVSPIQLRDPAFASGVLQTIREWEIDPARIQLEFTENAALLPADCESSIGQLNRLKVAGVRLALDDFGAGYSALAQLPGLPFDTLKIDRGFLDRVPGLGPAEVLLRRLIELGHEMGYQIIVEGVERPSQLEFLRGVGCEGVQGYLLGRPGGQDSRRRDYQPSFSNK